jgi:hypothetical protein
MKIIEITSKKEEKILTNYLARTCGAWVKKGKLYLPLPAGLNYFGSKEKLKSFIIHTSFSPVTIKQKYINLDKLTTLQFAEILFGGESTETERNRHDLT